MKTMKKIVAVLAAVLMLCSILPLSAVMADTEIVFTLGADGTATHKDGSTAKADYSETVDGYTLSITGGSKMYPASIDGKGNGCIKLGTGSAVGGFSFTVPDDVTSVVIAVAKYKANTTKLSVNGTAYTLTKNSNDGAYDEITVDTTSTKTITLTTVSGGLRAMVNTITFVIAATGSANCDHASLKCGDTCSECGEYTKEHAYANNCTAECENGCGTANPNYADHVYGGGIYDEYCDVCNAKREVTFPEADTELTIAEALALGAAMEHNVYTPGKYYITGEITEVYNTQYGNLYLTDGENTITVYGLYDGNGNRYDAMTNKPEAGMTVKLYGPIGSYNGTAQMKNADLISMEGGCAHEYEFECSTICSICGQGERDVACVNNNPACSDGLCIYCGGDVDALDHAYDSEYDPDCNYCGEIREVEEAPSTATITFDDKGKMTSSSTTEQVWQENGIVINYAKGNYNNNLAEYANPIRFYAGTTVTIHFSGITSIEIEANTAAYATALGNSIADSVVEDKVVTYILPAVADSFTFTLSAQARVNSITVYGSSSGSSDCEHSWNAATCTTPATCALCGATDGAANGHTYVEDIIDATCTAAGTATYECSVCLDSYDEVIPVKPHSYVDGICSGCGAELPLEATITFGEDKAQRTEYTNETQKWEHDGLTLVNNKAASTTAIGDYAGRFYKSSEIIISFPGMTSLVIDATGVDNDKLWEATLDAAGLTYAVDAKVYTITFAEPTDSITLTAANQVRAASMTASRVEVCQHEYYYACDAHCMKCYELTNPDAAHSVLHADAVAATCAANGKIEYWYCEHCGSAWADEARTQLTNMMNVVIPATGEHTYDSDYDADCNVCGDIREVPEEPVDIIYGDVNGDGEVDLVDAALLQQFLAEWDVTLDEAAADVNCDDEVDLVDAALLQQFLAEWDVTMGPDSGSDSEEDDENKVFNDGVLGWQ